MKGVLICIRAEPLGVMDFSNPRDHLVGYLKFPDRLHIDPVLDKDKGFTYCDVVSLPRAANLGKLSVSDYILFQETFKNKHKPSDKRRYIFAYIRLKEIIPIREVFEKGLNDKHPYCHNDHIKHGEGCDFAPDHKLFIGDPDNSKMLVAPLWVDRDLIKELDLRDRSGNPIYAEFDRKRVAGRLMTDIEVINVYTRVAKLLSEDQVELLIGKIGK